MLFSSKKFFTKNSKRRSFSQLKVGGISDSLLINVAFGWGVQGTDMPSLVESLKKANLLKNERLIEAMKQVDRAFFVPPGSSSGIGPYENRPHPFQLSRSGPSAEVSLSTPQMHAQALEVLAPAITEGARCLDVGCGSGFILAVLSVLSGKHGFAVGIDVFPEVVEDVALICLKKSGLLGPKIHLMAGDIRSDAVRKKLLEKVGGPFQAIHFGAAASSRAEMEPVLENLLAPGGRLVCPIMLDQSKEGGHEQLLWQFDKSMSRSEITAKEVGRVMCAPLQNEADNLPVTKLKFLPRERLDQIKKELSDWKEKFFLEHARAPSKDDLATDEHAKKLFIEFSTLNRRNWNSQ